MELLGLTLIKRTKPEEAIPVYKSLLENEPNNYEGINNLAFCYSNLGKREDARLLLKKGICLYPDKSSLYWNLAIQYKEEGNFDEANNIYIDGIKALPDCPELHYNYGICLMEQGRYTSAIDCYDKAIQLDPNHANAHWNKALVLLLMGNYVTGFEEYEWRFKAIPAMEQIRNRFKNKPEWNGESNVTILLYSEQGLGDALQFLRYVPLLKSMGCKVIVEAIASLVDLVSTIEGIDQIVQWRSKEIPEYDYHLSLGSLPRVFGTNLLNIPINIPYVKSTGEIDPSNFKDYKNKLKVGICWAGSPYHSMDHIRSCNLREFKSIGDLSNIKLFSLQKETGKRFHKGFGVVDLTDGADDMTVVDMSDLMQDFNYTAAIIEKMDLIITVDTVVAHLAGAMGKKCWVLLPSNPDWRWGSEKETSPWYPSIRLFRQNKGEIWADVFHRVLQELK
jgi:Tfp pilus assembly protein PilF